jgi:hypothetical protein
MVRFSRGVVLRPFAPVEFMNLFGNYVIFPPCKVDVGITAVATLSSSIRSKRRRRWEERNDEVMKARAGDDNKIRERCSLPFL